MRAAADLERLGTRLRAAREVALDTEGDSLHHYPERLALLQFAERAGETWLVDPLALPDLAPLAPVFADAGVLIIVHAGDNDLVQLKRRYRFSFAGLFDTSIAARFLGVPALGLDVLLTRYVGVELPPSRQKDDWSARPLSPAQEQYAVADVRHLFELKDKLVAELGRAGRLAWVEEECAALAAQPVQERAPDPDAFAGLKGARELSPRGLAALRGLYELRETLALRADRPPFKILGNETLVRLAGELPSDREALARIPGCTPRVIERWGDAILAAIRTGATLDEAARPRLEHRGRPPLATAVRRRIEALRAWRTEAAPRVGLEAGVVLPNRLIGAVAEAAPRTTSDLLAIDGLRRWRVEVFGDELLRAMAPVVRGPSS
ncbi:MAG TPA: HRDC domain-containing protein [Methylomirabilota bacterium]